MSDWIVTKYLFENFEFVWPRVVEHVTLSGLSLLIALLISLPLGLALSRAQRLATPVLVALGLLYTIPSFALFAFLVPFAGIGQYPAIVALSAYALVVLVRNNMVAFMSVDPAVKEAARGMGMTARQQLFLVQLPLGLPIILAGVRVAAVAALSITTIGAAIGAGGLGVLIFEGIRTINGDRIIAGTIVIAALALAVDRGLAWWGERLRRDTVTGERG
mgnify:CR=1 FL=1